MFVVVVLVVVEVLYDFGGVDGGVYFVEFGGGVGDG